MFSTRLFHSKSVFAMNNPFVCSESRALRKLETLDSRDVAKIKEAFVLNKAMRFQKYFHTGWGSPYGDRGDRKRHREKVLAADFQTLGKLIKICGLLLQTKVYLIWDKNWKRHTCRLLKSSTWILPFARAF